MTTQILIPILGEAISEARLLSWLKEPGQEVRRGEDLAELETDKATLALECPAHGVLLSILAPAGATVFPGQVVAVIGQPGESVADALTEGQAGSFPEAQVVAPPEAQVISAPESNDANLPNDQVRVSPAARRLAKELGIDIHLVQPARPGERITSEDVQLAASQKSGASPKFRRIPLNAIRLRLAQKMIESASQIPQFSVAVEIDAAALLAFKASLENPAAQPPRTSLTAILIQRVANVLMRHPLLNARFDQESLILYESVNMAVAIATEEGLVAPVIHSVEQLSVQEISVSLTELTHRARSASLTLEQVSGATFTISNLGMYSVHQFTPLINPPQSAILGVGAARPVGLPNPGEIRPAQWMNLTVSADHRVLDGALVARFLGDLKNDLESVNYANHSSI